MPFSWQVRQKQYLHTSRTSFTSINRIIHSSQFWVSAYSFSSVLRSHRYKVGLYRLLTIPLYRFSRNKWNFITVILVIHIYKTLLEHWQSFKWTWVVLTLLLCNMNETTPLKADVWQMYSLLPMYKRTSGETCQLNPWRLNDII